MYSLYRRPDPVLESFSGENTCALFRAPALASEREDFFAPHLGVCRFSHLAELAKTHKTHTNRSSASHTNRSSASHTNRVLRVCKFSHLAELARCQDLGCFGGAREEIERVCSAVLRGCLTNKRHHHHQGGRFGVFGRLHDRTHAPKFSHLTGARPRLRAPLPRFGAVLAR